MSLLRLRRSLIVVERGGLLSLSSVGAVRVALRSDHGGVYEGFPLCPSVDYGSEDVRACAGGREVLAR